MKSILALLVLCRVAVAQVSPVVVSDFPLTGKGSTSSHLRLTATCASGQTLKWNSSAWVCADLASVVSGTLNKLARFTPDGSHVGNAAATDDGTTLTLGTTIALTEATGQLIASNIGHINNLWEIDGANITQGVTSFLTQTAVTYGSAAFSGRVAGTVDTTGSPGGNGIAAVGGTFSAVTTRVAGTDPHNNYGVFSTTSGGATLNVSYYATSSGTGAFTFYGAAGSFFNNDTGTFGSSLFADSTHRVIDQTASSARIVQTGPSIDLATIGTGAGSCTNCSVTFDIYGRETGYSSGTAPVTAINVTAPITSTGGTTPTIGLADTAVTPGSYTYATLTVDQKGRLTAASSGVAPLVNTNIILTTNRIGKGSSTAHTVIDSSITDDGSTVTLTEPVTGTTANFTSSTASATFTAYANGTNRAANINGLDNETFASFDTSAAARTGYGLQAWSYGTKGIAGHTLTNIAVYATAFNGDVNQDFYGASGDFMQLGIGEFGGALKADSTLLVTGAATLSSTLHLVGAGTFDSTLNVASLATLTGGFSTGADGTVNGNLTVASRLVYKDAQMDQGTLYTLASGSTTNLKGATSGTFTASGTTETVSYGIAFTTVPSCWISTEGSTKGYTYSRTTTQLTLASLTNGQKYDWKCEGH